MKSYSLSAFLIALQIWLVALCCNTLVGSFLLSYPSRHYSDFGGYVFFGAYFGSIFSFPIFIVLWVISYFSLKAGYPAPSVFKVLLATGLLLSFAASALFTISFGRIKGGIVDGFIFLLAPASGAVSILISYRSIKAACRKRDEANILVHYADTDESTTQSE